LFRISDFDIRILSEDMAHKLDIHIDDLVITYNKGKANEFNALQHIKGEIYPREYIILFGPSGCGKSTLLYTIMGGIPPESGHMWVKGEDIYAYRPQDMNRYQQSVIGIVYQQFNLIMSLSVLDNVALPRLFLGRPPAERNARASELLRRFGIPERLEDKLPMMMSGGQQQRVSVARALVNDPEILLADEPVGNLDSISSHHVMESFLEVNEKYRKTVILVTHNAAHLPYAHRVFYMRDGVMRRIAVNPAKAQIKRLKPGEAIETEIEQLTRLYPYLDPIELKVKSVVNFATQEVGFTELENMERWVLEVLKGSIDEETFFHFLSRRTSNGGMGLSEETSRMMAKKVFKLVAHSQDVRRFRETINEDDRFMHQKRYIDRIIEYLHQEIGVDASLEQKIVLQTAVGERVGGILKATEFEEKLVLPFHLDGAAFREHEAYLLARHLEKLIAQGGYKIQANELKGAHS
jgi:putative ABC transport system ATP-binding protein